MGTIAEKLTYLNTTKIKLRDSLNKFGSNILSTDTFRSYDTKLNDIYDKLPKVTQSGAGLTITPVQNGQVDDFKMIGTDLYQNQLPSEYTAVEYLQSDNECFIDTGINADYKLSLKMKVACLDSVLEYMGAIKNIDNTNYIRHHLAFAPTAGNIIGIYYGQTNDQLILKEFDNNFHEFNLDIYNKKVSIDNNSTISISYNNFNVGINYYLFARNGSNIAISKGSYKIAYCKMYYEDNLVRDFTPCYRNSDNVAGLYDFVTNTFFTNQGTGTFTVGNNITLPNPNYPQDIKVVEGRQVITDKGKNLFDKDNITKLNGTININSNDFEGGGLNYAVCISCKPNTTYTVTKRNDGNTNRFALASSETIPSSTISELTPVLNKIRDNDSSTLTLTTEISANYLIVQYYRSAESILTEQQILDSIQIEESSTATNYEPYYNPVSYNIDLHGENVFNLEKYPFTPKVAYSSTGYQELNWTGYSGIKDYFPINGNTTYSFSNSTGLDIYYGLVFYDKNKTIISNITAHTTTFTTPSNCEYIRFSIHTEELPTWVQIEEGSTTTNYEEYYDYKLAKMPNTDYKNRIYKNNGNWYYEKNIEKIILDGNATWYKYNNNFCLETITNYNRVTNIPICTHFKGIDMTIGTSISIEDNDKTIRFGNNENHAFRLFIIDSDFSDAGVLKNFLLTHNVELWYILATPVTTQITNTTLISQLEAISVHTGTNIITISNDNNIIPEIEITRLKELEKLA